MKTRITTALALTSGLALAGTVQAQTPPTVSRVIGTVSHSHAGTQHFCIVVNGQDYAIDNIYPNMALTAAIAASDGAVISFEIFDPATVPMTTCRRIHPAVFIHDVDRDYP